MYRWNRVQAYGRIERFDGWISFIMHHPKPAAVSQGSQRRSELENFGGSLLFAVANFYLGGLTFYIAGWLAEVVLEDGAFAPFVCAAERRHK